MMDANTSRLHTQNKSERQMQMTGKDSYDTADKATTECVAASRRSFARLVMVLQVGCKRSHTAIEIAVPQPRCVIA